MASIRHSSSAHPGKPSTLHDGGGLLPDFRNLGLVLRLVLAVNGLALLAVLLKSADWAGLGADMAELAARVEPPLLFCLLFLHAAQPFLSRLSYPRGALAVVTCATACALSSNLILAPFGEPWSWRPALWGALAAAALLYHADLRGRALAPALAEARLLALTARIRPHFLFNSLNAVLGILRADPRRAEAALEELADLFRALMKENQDLVSLGEEIGLCRQYLNLERLRLGERLVVRWDVESCPPDARVPPLLLQPLLENAVHHGIEPASEPGEILIRFARKGDEVIIELSNPWHGTDDHHEGNRMALDNVRQRLMLFFDLEARLETVVRDGRYRLTITLPYRRGAP